MRKKWDAQSEAELAFYGTFYRSDPLPGLRVSPDGTRVAYVDYIPGQEPEDELSPAPVAVFVDGKEPEQRFDYDGESGEAGIELEISSLIFSPDSRHYAYQAFDNGDTYVFLDGRKTSGGDESCGSDPRFSPDGKRFAYIDGCNRVAVIDGRRGKEYDNAVHSITFSPDSKRVAYVGSTQQLTDVVAVVDGQEGKSYGDVRGESFRFSPDSKRLAYVAANYFKGRQEAFVVLDGAEGKHYGDIGYPDFSPDGRHMAYMAKIAEQKLTFVVDGEEGKVYDAWYASRAVFSPDSRHVAYGVLFQKPPASSPTDGVMVVVDGHEGTRHNGKNIVLSDLRFSPDSKHLAYLIVIDPPNPGGGEGFVVSDGKEGKHYFKPGSLTFSPDGAHLAYAAGTSLERFVVLDGQEGKHYSLVQNLVFSPDGKTLAYAAYNGKTKKWFVVVNGQEGNPYAQVEDLVFSPDGKYLAYAVHNAYGRNWYVVVNGTEGKDYGGILVNSALERSGAPAPGTRSLRFDGPHQLHYLAISGKSILLVKEQLGEAKPRSEKPMQ